MYRTQLCSYLLFITEMVGVFNVQVSPLTLNTYKILYSSVLFYNVHILMINKLHSQVKVIHIREMALYKRVLWTTVKSNKLETNVKREYKYVEWSRFLVLSWLTLFTDTFCIILSEWIRWMLVLSWLKFVKDIFYMCSEAVFSSWFT
jgi:hypothetical protein